MKKHLWLLFLVFFIIAGCQSNNSVDDAIIDKVDFVVKLPSELPVDIKDTRTELMVNSFTGQPDSEIRVFYIIDDNKLIQLNILDYEDESTFSNIGLKQGSPLKNGTKTWFLEEKGFTSLHWRDNGTAYFLNNTNKKDQNTIISFLSIEQLEKIANSFK